VVWVATEGYLLDTVIASWLWDGGNPNHAACQAWLASLGDSPVFVSAITIGEIAYGLGVSPAIDPRRHAQVRAAMTGYEVLSVDRHTAETYGQIRAALFARYSPRGAGGRMQKKVPEDLAEPTTGKALGIQESDLWIVSTAVQYDLQLVTNDRVAGMRRVLDAAGYLHHTVFWPAPPLAP
jgi:predicted nucleic acid-binding protein